MAKKFALGKAVVKHSPAVLSPIPQPKGLPLGDAGMGVSPKRKSLVPKMPGIPRSAPSPSKTRFRPSSSQLPGGGIGKPVRG